MTYLHHYIGLLGCLLVLIALPLSGLKQPNFSRKTITIAIFIVLGLVVLPINGLTLLVYVRAGLADLSITSMLLLCTLIATSYSGQSYLRAEENHRLGTSVLVGALLLYPLGLGLTPLDSYAAGFGEYWLLGLLLAFAGYLLWRKAYFVLSLLLIAIGAYLLNALQSNNLWDYLLDPWIVLLTLVRKIRDMVARLRVR